MLLWGNHSTAIGKIRARLHVEISRIRVPRYRFSRSKLRNIEMIKEILNEINIINVQTKCVKGKMIVRLLEKRKKRYRNNV